MTRALDLYAGPGGWSVALKVLGIQEIAVDNDPDTCATRRANGMPILECDVTALDPLNFLRADALIASPPCQTYSKMGNGDGYRNLQKVIKGLNGLSNLENLDKNTRQVVEPMRWIYERQRAGHPFTWIAMEQVPSVLPVWEEYVALLIQLGYFAVCGIVSAEEYGVPQTRKRAVLLAHRYKQVSLPEPTHQKYVYGEPAMGDPSVSPWISLAGALTPASQSRIHLDVNNQSGTEFDIEWQMNQPAQTIAGRPIVPFRGANANRFNGKTKSRNDGFKVTVEQMAALQTFPKGYQFVGNQKSVTKQIGNAVPPVLAEALLRQVV